MEFQTIEFTNAANGGSAGNWFLKKPTEILLDSLA